MENSLEVLTGKKCPHADVQMDAALGWFGCCCCRRELLYLKLGTLAVEVVLAIKAYMEEFQWCLKAICDSADDKGFLRHTLNDC